MARRGNLRLTDITPLTPAQRAVITGYDQGFHLATYGSAGTGKSFLATYLGLRDVFNPRSTPDRLILVRSAVPTRDLGFLKGTLEEKLSVYEAPYVSLVDELLAQPGAYAQLYDDGVIEFVSTSFVRSLTWNNAVVFLDEAQNMTFHELNSVVTRLGSNSRLIVSGDMVQDDLGRGQSGLQTFLRVASRISEFRLISFGRDDIVLSSFVRDWIVACAEEHVF